MNKVYESELELTGAGYTVVDAHDAPGDAHNAALVVGPNFDGDRTYLRAYQGSSSLLGSLTVGTSLTPANARKLAQALLDDADRIDPEPTPLSEGDRVKVVKNTLSSSWYVGRSGIVGNPAASQGTAFPYRVVLDGHVSGTNFKREELEIVHESEGFAIDGDGKAEFNAADDEPDEPTLDRDDVLQALARDAVKGDNDAARIYLVETR